MDISLDHVKELALENWFLRRENETLRAHLKATEAAQAPATDQPATAGTEQP